MELEPMKKKMMIEQAEEELQILETHHPNRFNLLKHEIISFINLLHSQSHSFSNSMIVPSTFSDSASPSLSATTQASSSCKKRKKKENGETRTTNPPSKQKLQRAAGACYTDDSTFRRKVDRVEFVIERAQTCLRKIQQFKTSF